MDTTNTKLILPILAFLLSVSLSSAQKITVPQPAQYTNDANTLLLQHFDGTTSGTPNGAVTYTNGVFGQGVHLNSGSWVSWNLGALSQGTVEFWGNLDEITNTGGVWPNFVRSSYSPFYAETFRVGLITNTPFSRYHVGFVFATNWIGVFPDPLPEPAIEPGVWHHYATTWGKLGFKFYIDGVLKYSSAVTNGQNTATSWWCIGGQNADGPGFEGNNFTGVIDELRISNVQRDFTPQDLDEDGLTDSEEMLYGTDPTKWDTDGDGLPDGMEVLTYQTNPLVKDTDRDGFNDYAEIYAGHSPLISTDYPAAIINAFTALELEFVTKTNTLYLIQSSSDLTNWTNFDGPISGDGDIWKKTYSIRGAGKLFYRVELSP